MIRLVAVGVVVVGAAAIVVVQLDGTAELVAWEVMLATAVVALSWSRWPSGPDPAGALIDARPMLPVRRPRSLAAVEVEVSGAVNETLAMAEQVRRRLMTLATDMAGEDLDEERGRELIGVSGWAILTGDSDVMELTDIESIVDRLEQL